MEHHVDSASEVTFHHEPGGSDTIKRIVKTTVLLSVITLIELGLGLWMYFMHKDGGTPSHALILGIKGVIVILSLAKAFYIVSIFMHLGDEIRNLIMTIVVPLALFIWFIIAFLWEGNAWLNLRNTDGHSRPNIEKHQAVPDAKKPGGVE